MTALAKTITIDLDEADIDWPSLQAARQVALHKMVGKTGLYPTDWPLEVWDEFATVFVLVYLCRYGNARHYAGMPIMRAQSNMQYVEAF